MDSHRYRCSHCKANVSRDMISCPSCTYLFINTVNGIKNVKEIKAEIKRKKIEIGFLLVFSLIVLGISGVIGGIGVDDADGMILFAFGGLVTLFSMIGIICSNQYIMLIHKIRKRATISDYGGYPPPSPPPPPFPPVIIYEYSDDGKYKWTCRFCGAENMTNKDRCLVCGYMKTKQ